MKALGSVIGFENKKLENKKFCSKKWDIPDLGYFYFLVQ